MRLGKNLLKDRAPGEVKYYDSKHRTGRAISGPEIGKPVPLPYGVECIETMDANGGWIASAVDLVRFAAALDDPAEVPPAEVKAILRDARAAAGSRWATAARANRSRSITPVAGRSGRPRQPGKYTKWHTGGWRVVPRCWFAATTASTGPCCSTATPTRHGKAFADLIDPLLHQPADEIDTGPRSTCFRPPLTRPLSPWVGRPR